MDAESNFRTHLLMCFRFFELFRVLLASKLTKHAKMILKVFPLKFHIWVLKFDAKFESMKKFQKS
jgi:hypothetical protein